MREGRKMPGLPMTFWKRTWSWMGSLSKLTPNIDVEAVAKRRNLLKPARIWPKREAAGLRCVRLRSCRFTQLAVAVPYLTHLHLPPPISAFTTDNRCARFTPATLPPAARPLPFYRRTMGVIFCFFSLSRSCALCANSRTRLKSFTALGMHNFVLHAPSVSCFDTSF